MKLPEDDHDYLRRQGYDYEVFDDGGKLCLLLRSVRLPPGLNQQQADILFRLEPLYPDAPPDMWWVSPALATANGASIPATECHETYRGRSWQRWSRHIGSGWLAGVDGIASYLALFWSEINVAAGVST